MKFSFPQSLFSKKRVINNNRSAFFTTRRSIKFIIFLFSFAGIALVSLFLYQKVFIGIEKALELSQKKTDVIDTTVDTLLYELVERRLEAKLSSGPFDVGTVDNPFIEIETTTETVTAPNSREDNS